MNEEHYERLRKVSDNALELEVLLYLYERKGTDYLHKDLLNGNNYSLHTPYLRRERFLSVVEYSVGRGWKPWDFNDKYK